GAPAAYARIRPRSVRDSPRSGSGALRRGAIAGARIRALEPVGHARALEPPRFSAGAAPRAARAAPARVAGALRLRDGRDTALPVPKSLQPRPLRGRGDREDAATRHLPPAGGRVPPQGAQAPLHPDARSAAPARAARRDRRARQPPDPDPGVVQAHTD